MAFTLGLLFGAVQIYWDFTRQQILLEQNNNHIIEMISPAASRAVHTLDSGLANEVVTGILSYDHVVGAKIVDELGATLAEGTLPEQKPLGQFAFIQTGERYKVYHAQLSIPGYTNAVSGQIFFTVDQRVALAAFYERSVAIYFFDLLRNMLLVLLLFIAFHAILTRPLIRLAKEMRAINFHRPGSQRFTSLGNRRDELADLVKNGNHLLESVETALSSRLSVESALRQSEEHLRQLIESLPVVVGARNYSGRFVFANKAMSELLGVESGALANALFSEVAGVNSAIVSDVYERDRMVIDTGIDQFVAEENWKAPDGRVLFLQSHYTPMDFRDQRVVLVVSTDITDRKTAEASMAHMAYHDALTGLPNRLQLVERLESEIHRAARHRYFGAVLFIDLDQFKNINDSLGHPAGDVVLKEISSRLLESVRDEDLVARLSGDEFVLVLTVLDSQMNDAALKASEIGEKVRQRIAEPIYHESMELRVTCSIGAVMFPEAGVTVHELLRFADTAMYQVKERGRDAIEFFNAHMAEQVHHQLLLEGQLHKALEESQFELVYQPKVSVKTGVLTGAEALLRWRHPTRGMVSPGEFIPILESSGLIIDVGQWILEEACRQLQYWQRQGYWHLNMQLSINISPRQFRREAFVDDVISTLRDVPIEKGSLDIEVTESVVIGNVDETVATMRKLVSSGITFSLDDFGTGYSSISYLKRLPVSTLKVDQSFVRDITEDRSDKVLVQTMATMGSLLGLKVVAEGVETEEQLMLIRDFGCHEYQGYFYSRPISADDFTHLLTESIASESVS
ncbi:putative bifunctional diguanylate cyclase/phosphodiesterase [Marinibactrum halimedae]|uniref:cyclic-guanylate-specific phosphodiesterase n=1 Tax=Marinibactrum halimedae TaxID=1444977 RepID=A0AA37TDV4_9GAMM|nr:EAL domain-containing protein [Marinibactrum halimedae]MCD9460880.1 EAL domain-containing protein [Marinibactrum halimedae]GLS27342.1 hypothetical protein GCM10007877_30610 [Marinibactrum halimedae]